MEPNLLVVNAGSSSVKVKLFDGPRLNVLAEGQVERVGTGAASLHLAWGAGGEARSEDWQGRAADHREALRRLLDRMDALGLLDGGARLGAVGHRVVHGGALYQPVRVGGSTMDRLRGLSELAPLHNPPNLACVEMALERFPGVAQVLVFDTAFHHGLPSYARDYALPRDLCERHGIRRYGFHGISHGHVSRQAAEMLGKPAEALDLVSLHLGHGASAAAIHGGRSMDTSMGFTPAEGLMMAARSGDLDPALPPLLEHLEGLDASGVLDLLNGGSGLKGVCGSGDMREIHRRAEAGDERAALARDMFCYRARKYLGAYLAVLGRLDALVFTGGIGENDPWVRAQVCAGLEGLGIALDPELNAGVGNAPARIQASRSRVAVLVIPADEEREIARQALALLGGG
ncbi:MAG: acetate kinase [Chromatiales bacterium]